MDLDVPKFKTDMDKLTREVESAIFRWKAWAVFVTLWLVVITAVICRAALR